MITLILGVFHHFCKSARSASRQRENFMESLHSDLLIIWVEKIIPLGMKSKQKPYPSIVFLSIESLNQIVKVIKCHIMFKTSEFSHIRQYKLHTIIRITVKSIIIGM